MAQAEVLEVCPYLWMDEMVLNRLKFFKSVRGTFSVDFFSTNLL